MFCFLAHTDSRYEQMHTWLDLVSQWCSFAPSPNQVFRWKCTQTAWLSECVHVFVKHSLATEKLNSGRLGAIYLCVCRCKLGWTIVDSELFFFNQPMSMLCCRFSMDNGCKATDSGVYTWVDPEMLFGQFTQDDISKAMLLMSSPSTLEGRPGLRISSRSHSGLKLMAHICSSRHISGLSGSSFGFTLVFQHHKDIYFLAVLHHHSNLC